MVPGRIFLSILHGTVHRVRESSDNKLGRLGIDSVAETPQGGFRMGRLYQGGYQPEFSPLSVEMRIHFHRERVGVTFRSREISGFQRPLDALGFAIATGPNKIQWDSLPKSPKPTFGLENTRMPWHWVGWGLCPVVVSHISPSSFIVNEKELQHFQGFGGEGGVIHSIHLKST